MTTLTCHCESVQSRWQQRFLQRFIKLVVNSRKVESVYLCWGVGFYWAKQETAVDFNISSLLHCVSSHQVWGVTP